MEQYDSKYFRGQGPLYLANRDANGAPTGFVFIGDVSAATLSPQIDRSEKLENVSGSSAIAVSALKSVKYGLSLTMDSVKAAHLAIALSASLTTKAAASVTDEAVTGYHDKFSALLHNKVSNVVVTDITGVTTYVADTDYVVKADEGIIEILSTGSIADAQALLVDYDYASQKHVKSDPGNVEKYLMFGGINTADNDKRTRCEVYKCKLDPGALSLITADVQGVTINGVVELDALRAAGDQLFSWKIED
jgi:hypothetical protein